MNLAKIEGKCEANIDEVLTLEALNFLEKLHNEFNVRRLDLLKRRVE